MAKAHAPLATLSSFKNRRSRVGTALACLVAMTLPFMTSDNFWIAILTTAGILALGAVGLNLVSGYLGEASLGQAFFLAIGCYAGAAAGMKAELPMLGWVLVVLAVGAGVGMLSAPLALRLSGPHLIVITLGLVFLGQYLFSNWRGLTGGPGGMPFELPLQVGSLDFTALEFGGYRYSAAQGLAFVAWGFVALAMWWVNNIASSRRGREMRALRDNALAAQVAGVSAWRCKLAAFAVSGALAALCGALYAQQISYVEPAVFDLTLSIEFVVILVVGGNATAFGPVLGATFVALVPAVLSRYLGDLPFVLGPNEDGFGMTVAQLSALIYALLLVLFLLFEPRGMNALIAKWVAACRRVVRTRHESRPAAPTT